MKDSITGILHQTRDIYNAIAGDFSGTRGKWWKGFGDFNKYVKPGDHVLDLGCGNGRMAGIFLDPPVSYLGLDNSEELIKIARKRFENNPEIRFETEDVLDLHLEKGKYSLVLLLAVLHHIPSKELRLKVLRDVFSCLKPGGRLVLSSWNLWQVRGSFNFRFRYWKHLFNFKEKRKRGVWSLNDAFVPWKANLPKGSWHLRYVHSFIKGETKRLLGKAGFEIEEIGYKKKGEKANILTGDLLLAVARKPLAR